MNRQLLIILSLIVIVPIGFLTKFYEGPAQSWVNNSLGGFFYEIFWCLVFAFIFLKTSPVKIAFWVFVVTCSLEFLQLWHPPFLQTIRSTFVGRTILGTSFTWFDFPYYFAGSFVGFLWLKGINKIISKSDN